MQVQQDGRQKHGPPGLSRRELFRHSDLSARELDIASTDLDEKTSRDGDGQGDRGREGGAKTRRCPITSLTRGKMRTPILLEALEFDSPVHTHGLGALPPPPTRSPSARARDQRPTERLTDQPRPLSYLTASIKGLTPDHAHPGCSARLSSRGPPPHSSTQDLERAVRTLRRNRADTILLPDRAATHLASVDGDPEEETC